MPPMNPRIQQRSPQCPACGGDPQRGRKKNEPPCKVCHGGMSDSPLGKRAMAQASNVGAAKFKQAIQQRQGVRGGGMPVARPAQAQPQVDPHAALAQALVARIRGAR